MSIYIKFTDDNSDSLTHYGVKGMKWKHRKHSSEYEQEMAYNSKSNDLPRSSYPTRKKTTPRLYDEGEKKSSLKSRKSAKYYSDKAKKKINKALSKTKKKIKKETNKTRKLKVGSRSIEVGRANSTRANGKKRKRYLLTKKNGRPTHYIPF